MDQTRIQQVADVLYTARQKVQPCSAISIEYGIKTLDEAYAIQEYNTQRLLQQGQRLVGRKIGLTSTVVQQQLGVDQPDFGMLFAAMEYASGDQIDSSQLIAPKAEGEIAFVLNTALEHEDVTLAELMAAIEYAVPALEIVDSAIADWKITITDTIADNASAALYVLGKTPVRLHALDLALEGMCLTKNQQIAATGVGAACLDNPLNACLWLARTMVQVGRPLQAGDVLLSGALGPMVPVAQGDHLELQLTRLGSVHCTFF